MNDFSAAVRESFVRYFDFEGRTSRLTYWYFFVFRVFSNIFLIFLTAKVLGRLGFLIFIALLPAGLASSVRRLHDIGRTGWHVLGPIALLFISMATFAAGPKAGSSFDPQTTDQLVVFGVAVFLAAGAYGVILIIWALQAGDSGPNDYGHADDFSYCKVSIVEGYAEDTPEPAAMRALVSRNIAGLPSFIPQVVDEVAPGPRRKDTDAIWLLAVVLAYAAVMVFVYAK